MRTLSFEVNKQTLKKKAGCDFSKIVAGSVGYLRAKFYFSRQEWLNCKKVATFKTDDSVVTVPLDNDDSCIIPSAVLNSRYFYVTLAGARSPGYKIVTNEMKVKQEVN